MILFGICLYNKKKGMLTSFLGALT